MHWHMISIVLITVMIDIISMAYQVILLKTVKTMVFIALREVLMLGLRN